jgi:hypothetical protein
MDIAAHTLPQQVFSSVEAFRVLLAGIVVSIRCPARCGRLHAASVICAQIKQATGWLLSMSVVTSEILQHSGVAHAAGT